ncbi:GNAT family N-acetyltransferase [Deinococcus navajonensis]|uniref:GNAT family N-acetyltransferase n=1 Tax=Deinococcus navajonensis TaxID=309884 RepID=A0ABV8XR15_9DEIO
MNTWTIAHPTLPTLSDLHALVSDPAEAAERTRQTRQRLENGQLKLEQWLILRDVRGVEGVALISANSRVPTIPRFRRDVSPAHFTALLRAVHHRAGPQGRLVLQEDLAPMNWDAAAAAGWHIDSEELIYQTDLRGRLATPEPDARSLRTTDLDRPDLQALLAALDRADLSLPDDWTLVGLPAADGTLVALGACGPARPGTGGIDLIGVHPAYRGRGLGKRLHAYLLGCLAGQCSDHSGVTGADNLAMRGVFAASGSQHIHTQLYFRALP